MVEGLSENRWALLSKVHHCMVDGVSATDLMTVMFDDSRPRPAAASAGSRRPSRATSSSLLRTLTRQALNPSEQVRVVAGGGAPAAGDRSRRCRRLVRGVASAAGVLRAARSLVAHRPGRAAPDVEHGLRPPQRRQDDPLGPRRDRQRRRANDRRRRAARAAAEPRRGRRGPERPGPGPGVGSPAGRAGRVQQPGVRDVRRRCRWASQDPVERSAVGARADGRVQAVEAGRGRRGPHLALGLRAAAAARARRPARPPDRRRSASRRA